MRVICVDKELPWIGLLLWGGKNNEIDDYNQHDQQSRYDDWHCEFTTFYFIEYLTYFHEL